MSEEKHGAKVDIGGVIHAGAGLIALVAGALMYTRPWAGDVFAGLMILSAISAVLISWRSDAWVPGHWLAMAPVVGVIAGYAGWAHGFTLAYVCLWIAFTHFIVRGIQLRREAAAGRAEHS